MPLELLLLLVVPLDPPLLPLEEGADSSSHGVAHLFCRHLSSESSACWPVGRDVTQPLTQPSSVHLPAHSMIAPHAGLPSKQPCTSEGHCEQPHLSQASVACAQMFATEPLDVVLPVVPLVEPPPPPVRPPSKPLPPPVPDVPLVPEPVALLLHAKSAIEATKTTEPEARAKENGRMISE